MKTSPLVYRSFCALFVLAVTLSACSAPAPVQTPTLTAIAEHPVGTPTNTPTPTLLPEIYLSELTPEYSQVGFGSLGVGVYAVPDAPEFDGRAIRAHGVNYPHGLMAHAPSTVVYQLDSQYRIFRTKMLVQDELSCGDGVIFRVLVDGNEVYASTPVTGATDPQETELVVAGVQTLTLVADMRQAGDCDWAIWGDPVLIPIGGVAQDYPTATLRPTTTSNPDLPCGGIMPERIYLFLDCNDIRRVRADSQSGDYEFRVYWDALVTTVDNYRSNFPTTFNPDASYPALWSGAGNYFTWSMALIYLVTGDPQYARDILHLLDLVVSQTPKRTVLTNFDTPSPGGLDNSGGLLSHPRYGGSPYQSLLFGYFVIRGSTFVDEAQRDQYDRFFINQANLLEQAAIFRGNTTPLDSWINRNVPMSANISALTIASIFPDDQGMQALTERIRPRLEWQLANWWEQDGGWGENSNGYGFGVLRSILIYAESLLKTSGENIYQAEYGGVSVHTLCNYFLKSVTPEGDPPQINDTSFGILDPGTLMLCAKRTNDALLTFAAQEYLWGYDHAYGTGHLYDISPFETIVWWDPVVTQTLTPPSWTSVSLPSTGLGIFRSDWSHEAQYGLLKYTASRVHAHYTFGEFFLYDHGPWLVGPGYHLDVASNQYTTDASTLTFDNSQQITVGGELAAFVPLEQTGYMAVTSPSYANLTHTRRILWNRAWHQWLVVDDAAMNVSPSGHSLQVRWYVRGTEASHDLNGNWTFTRPDYPGYLSVQMPSSLPATYSPISRSYPTEHEGDANGVEMDVTPAALLTRLVSVLTYSNTQPASYPLVSRDDSGHGLLVTIQPAANSPIWDWLLPAPGQTEVASGGYTMTGAAGCVWKQSAALSGYCLYAGTAFNQGALVLEKSDQKTSVEADFAHNTIKLDAPADSSMELYWPSTVSVVGMDGAPLSFSLAGNQLILQVPAGAHTITLSP